MGGNAYDHQKSSLDLELFVDPLILCQIVPQLFIETVALGCFDNPRGKDLKRKQYGSIAEPVRFQVGH